jgi:hypothetical protein
VTRHQTTVVPPALEELAAQVLGDLDPQQLGLPWLCPDLATRILLSDYLVDALATARQALREAELALDQFTAAVTEAERRTRRQLRKTSGADPVPPPSTARELELIRRDSSITNFFRAAGSVMDNMAAATAVIGGIDIEVVERLTWPKLEGEMRAANQRGSLSPEQSTLLAANEASVTVAGPDGWLPWTLAMRNMLVHRPRRLWLVHLRTRRDARGRIIGARLELLLPLDPASTDVEGMRGHNDIESAVILEPAENAMFGVLSSLTDTTKNMSINLSALYSNRAADPLLIIQPISQWRTNLIPPVKTPFFRGYNPGATPLDVTSLLTGPDMQTRLAASAVFDSRNTDWPTWLGATATLRQTSPRRPRKRHDRTKLRNGS